jgi:hypothetical protein
MKNGRTYETTEGTEKHSGSSKRVDKKAETSGGGEKTGWARMRLFLGGSL